jgi:plastocyanin
MRSWIPAYALPLTLILLNLTTAGCTGPVAGTPAAPTEAMAHGEAKEKQPADSGEATPGAPNQVVIDNFTYSPVSLTVSPGTKVTFVNHDDVPHTVTSPSKPRILDSPTLDTDDKFTFEFKTPGTYDYFCAVHPKMTGKIIVK